MGKKEDQAQTLVVPYPRIPLEDIYVPHGFLRGVTSKHTFDLRAIFVGVLVATYLVAVVIASDPKVTTPVFWGSQILAAMFTSFLATFAAIYQLSKLRFSAIDVFSSEILARLRILGADNTVARIIANSDPHHVELTTRHGETGKRGASGVLEPSRENQFEIFHKRSSDLGVLASVVVDHVTDFYSFQMASRDALRELSAVIEAFPTEAKEIRDGVINVIFMIDLMAYSGYRALDELIETAPHRLHARQVALSVATRANAYLVENMSPDDHRFAEVVNRSAKYARLARELKTALKPPLLGKGLIPRGAEYF